VSTPGTAGPIAADHAHLARALQLAGQGLYSAAPNPAVGCVVVDARGDVCGEGWHRRAGEPHAEVHALAAAGARARGGSLYVTLEPCAHHGRTPPCVDAVLAAGVRRVVAAAADPDPRVAGRGLARLREAGVEVVQGVLEAAARELNRGFYSRTARGRPWVTVKLGQSVDGRTALADGSSRWITGEAARADVQRLRARASLVLTGIGTVLADDPSLTVRDPALPLHGRPVARGVLDTHGRLPARVRLASDGHPTVVFCAAAAAGRLAAALPAGSVTVRTAATAATGGLDLDDVLGQLAALECNEVLVEAGPRLAGAMVGARRVDELVLYVAPALLGHDARAAFELPAPLRTLEDRQGFVFHDVRRVGADLRLTLRPAEG
jgi:diaminohydroxyphosphoribosylaminopyrimidine deaminase/5-amino-6-(5-phosphoribosylamino)uracil reductase